MLRKILFLCLVVFCCIYIFAAKSCQCKPGTIHGFDCSWVPGIICTFNVIDGQQIYDNIDSAEMQIILPSWLGLDNPESQMLFSASSKDLQDKPFGMVKLTPTLSLTSDSVIVSKLVVSPELKKTFGDFLQNVKPNEDINFQVNFPFYNLKLKTVSDDAYKPFEVKTMLFLNGTQSYEYSFQTSLSEVFADYLSSAIDQIPDSAFVNNPEQKRTTLHNKLNAAINAFEAKNATGTYQQITQDIIPKIQDWVIDPQYKENTVGAFNKVASILSLLKAK